MYSETLTDGPECGGTSGFRPTQKGTSLHCSSTSTGCPWPSGSNSGDCTLPIVTQSYRLMLVLFSLSVPPRNAIWHCHPYILGNLCPNCSLSQFPDGGTSYQMQSEQGDPSRSSRVSWRLMSPKNTSSPNTSNTIKCLTHTYCALIYLIILALWVIE